MSTRRSFGAFRSDLVAAADRMRTDAEAAGTSAPVPTCPGWTVTDLLVHQGNVHRWATAHVRGLAPRGPSDRFVTDVARHDPIAWLAAGVPPLLDALDAMADDAEAYVFLLDAPPPRRFWARRQAHETAIHAVDALAARLGRPVTAEDVDLDPGLAEDGVDEVLRGIAPQPGWTLRDPVPYRLGIEATDTGRAWTLGLGPDPVVTHEGLIEPVQARITGPAAELYLGLWNRSPGLVVEGRPEFAGAWRAAIRVD